jgi:oligoribonuclease
MNPSHLVWVDCEMTGLDLGKDALIEVSCVVTDSELNALDEGIDIVIKPPAESLVDMDDVVVKMHTESGLLTELDAGTTLAEAEAQLLEYIRGHVPEARKAPLAGSSVHVDRAYLARDMPTLTEYLHYRIVDVSSIKELVRRWYPRAYFASPEKRGGHRALADILDSINELRYYREAVFVAPPGPDSATAKAITVALDTARDGA